MSLGADRVTAQQIMDLQRKRLGRWFMDALETRGAEFTPAKQLRWWEEATAREKLEVEVSLREEG